MTKPFDTLYADLEKALRQRTGARRDADVYLHGIELIRDRIGKMQTHRTKFIRNEGTEIEFFRSVWPAFHGKLFLYLQLHEIELRREVAALSDWPAILLGEEDRVGRFFRTCGRFWRYYRCGAQILDQQFTRGYSRSRIFDPLSMVIDAEGATLASYRAACCLAMQAYGEWLREERSLLSAGAVSAADLGYSWGASDADLAEWLFGVQAVGALQYQGQPADVSRLQKWARLALGRDVANIYNRARILRNRKKERLAFTKKIASALEKKWDQAEGKFD